jgi:2-oxoisovalerate dehydrogenase E1 component
MGVHWALQAAKHLPDQISILDLRTLYPLDTDLIYEQAKAHHRCIVLTEESVDHSLPRAWLQEFNKTVLSIWMHR